MKNILLLLCLLCPALADQPLVSKLFPITPGDYILIQNPYSGKEEPATAQRCFVVQDNTEKLFIVFKFNNWPTSKLELTLKEDGFTFQAQKPVFDGVDMVSDLAEFSLKTTSPSDSGYEGTYSMLNNGKPIAVIPIRLIKIDQTRIGQSE